MGLTAPLREQTLAEPALEASWCCVYETVVTALGVGAVWLSQFLLTEHLTKLCPSTAPLSLNGSHASLPGPKGFVWSGLLTHSPNSSPNPGAIHTRCNLLNRLGSSLLQLGSSSFLPALLTALALLSFPTSPGLNVTSLRLLSFFLKLSPFPHR